MAKNIFIFTFIFLCLAVGILGLICPTCDKSTCEPPVGCKYGTQGDICGCCERCLKGPGEPCGGIWNLAGDCGNGFRCTNEWTGEIQEDNQEAGKCIGKGPKRLIGALRQLKRLIYTNGEAINK